jgi:hypothetical protein
MTHSSPLPSSVVIELQRLTRTELSRGARLGHVVLALGASAMTIIVLSLWLTEPALPLRTRIAFAALTAIGTGWTAFAVWVLSARRVMLVRHRQVAGRLAVLFSSVFTVGCLVLALAAETDAARPALGMSLGLLMIAAVVWRRAERAQAKLLVRRAQLEQELDRRPE